MEHLMLAVDWLNSLPTSVLIGVAVILVTLYYWPIWQRHRYPPGPLPWPFLGNVPLYISQYKVLHKYFYEHQSEVFTTFLDVPTVWLNSTEAIYEAFAKNGDVLSNRPVSTNSLKALGVVNGGGIISSPDGVWQELRRLLLTVFRERGVGKMEMEDVISNEVKYFHEVLEGLKEGPIDLKDQIRRSISNITTHIAFGTRFEYDEEQLANLKVEEYFAAHYKTAPAPILRYLPFDPTGYQKARERMMKTLEFIRGQIKEHTKTVDYNSPRDFIDAFLVQRKKHGNSDSNIYNEDNLIAVLLQMYVAGTDTASSVLYWTFLYLVLRPHMQERVYQEIKANIGERTPTYSDKVNMPYTMAVICELLRIDVGQRSLAHVTTQDVVVRGHTIPKGTNVVANIWANTHDIDQYKEPEKFNPDNFLDVNGNHTKPEGKKLMPFGIGKRSCPGENLARMEIFMFFVCTLQKYQVLLGQEEMPSTDGVLKFVYLPTKQFKVRFVPRL